MSDSLILWPGFIRRWYERAVAKVESDEAIYEQCQRAVAEIARKDREHLEEARAEERIFSANVVGWPLAACRFEVIGGWVAIYGPDAKTPFLDVFDEDLIDFACGRRLGFDDMRLLAT